MKFIAVLHTANIVTGIFRDPKRMEVDKKGRRRRAHARKFAIGSKRISQIHATASDYYVLGVTTVHCSAIIQGLNLKQANAKLTWTGFI